MIHSKYKTGLSHQGKPTIIISRPLYDIPMRIDLELIRLAGHSFSEGERVIYEFLVPNKLQNAEKMLKDCSWEKE